MRTSLRIASLFGLLSSTAAAVADDRISSPPADLALAYAHPQLASSRLTRAMSVAPDGTIAAYVVRQPAGDGPGDSDLFLPTGAPAGVARGARIMLIDLERHASTRLCPSAGNDWNPVWSPDGRRLVFYSDRDGEARLWLYERAAASCRRVTERPVKSLPWAHENPRWSPDGSMIYFASWPAGGRGAPAQARARVVPSSAPAISPGAITLYRHEPAAGAQPGSGEPGAAAQIENFDERCGRGGYLAASLAVAPVNGVGESRLVVAADAESSDGKANRHFPSPYFRVSASGRWLSYFDTPCRRPGQPHATATRLFAVRAEGGAPTLIADNLRSPVGGDENILNYRWSPVADELVFLRDGALWRVSFDADGPAPPQRLGESLGPLAGALQWYSEDGAMLLVGTDPVQNAGTASPFGFDMGLALLPLAGGDPARVGLDRQRWAIQGVVTRDDRSLLQPGPGTFRLLARDKNTGENVVLTIDWLGDRVFETWRGRGSFHDLQAAAAGRLIGIFEDFRTPANLFAFSADSRTTTRLTDVSPELREAAFGSAELFDTVVPRPDGTLTSVRTAVLLPRGARRGDRLPAVVMLYPGSDLTESLSQFGAPAVGDPSYLLTRRGYAVILTNVAIGPGNERGHVIDEIMDSLMPQVHRAANLGYVDINRLAIRGHSFGAFATVAVIARTNLFRAAIPSAGAYDLGGRYADVNFIHGIPVDRSNWSETSQPRFGQPLWDDPLRYIQNSPYYLADRIRTPVLILQGTDDFTGGREGGRLFAALRRLDRPVELALYQGGGHVPATWPLAQVVDQMARTIDFLHRRIGPGWSAR